MTVSDYLFIGAGYQSQQTRQNREEACGTPSIATILDSYVILLQGDLNIGQLLHLTNQPSQESERVVPPLSPSCISGQAGFLP